MNQIWEMKNQPEDIFFKKQMCRNAEGTMKIVEIQLKKKK